MNRSTEKKMEGKVEKKMERKTGRQRKLRRAGMVSLAAMLSLQCVVPAFAAKDSSPEKASEPNPLKWKSVLFIGDSICKAGNELPGGAYATGKDIVGWPGRIIENNDMVGANLGRSGASISTCRGANTVVSQLDGQTTYDFIIMHGGVNDAWDSAPAGTMTEGFDGPFDTATFAGGLEDLFNTAKTNFPSSQLGYIINYKTPMAPYGRLSDMSEYVDTAIKICDKWGIPYLDLFHNEEFSKEMRVDTKIYLDDYIHPNKKGYDILAPYIENWMKTIAGPAYEVPTGSDPDTSEDNKQTTGKDNIQEQSQKNDKAPVTAIVLGSVIAIAVLAGVVVVIVLVRRNKKSE